MSNDLSFDTLLLAELAIRARSLVYISWTAFGLLGLDIQSSESLHMLEQQEIAIIL